MVKAEACVKSFERATQLHEQGSLSEAALLYEEALNEQEPHFELLYQFGLLRAQQGRLAEALELLSRARATDENCAEVHNHTGFVLHALNRHADAIACFDRALSIDGEFAEAYYNRGVTLHALRRYDDAIADYARALAINPQIFQARYNSAAAFEALKRPADAIVEYTHALAIQPKHALARIGLAAALSATGRHEQAASEYSLALKIDPQSATAHEGMGNALRGLGRHEDAIAHYRKALTISPRQCRVLKHLAAAQHSLKQYEDAATALQQVIQINPSDADAHNNLGLMLQHLNRHHDAVRHFRTAISFQPNMGAARNNLGSALQALNRHDEAIIEFESAIAFGSATAERYANLGMALQEVGRLNDAVQAFARAIELAPRNGRFFRNLANCKQFAPGDPHLTAMLQLATDIDSLTLDSQKQLLFALSKAHADIGDHWQSFGYVLKGNAIKRQHIDYDEPKVLGEFSRIMNVFDDRLVDRLRGGGHRSAVPIFIIGMPRSGTSLVEQILASHSEVFGAGERLDFKSGVSTLRATDDCARIFPEIVPHLSPAQLERLGAGYVRSISTYSSGARRITDKMPLNFFYAGLIHLALPNARIVHIRRNAVDTCLSCLATLFTGDHPVAYEMGELGRYYRAYERLMDHWRRVLPAHFMIEIRYEDLVANFEYEARKLVAHCGLEWEAACQEFHRARHPVRTASVAQVRRPIYRESVGRWVQYGELLRPLLDALGPDLVSPS